MMNQEERTAHKSAVQQHLNSMRQGDRERGRADVVAHVATLPDGSVKSLDPRAYAAYKQKLVSTMRRA